MWQSWKTSISLSLQIARARSVRLSRHSLRGDSDPVLKARRLTKAICGSATLALALVLGVWIALGATSTPAAEARGIVYLVNRPPAANTESAFIDSARPEDRQPTASHSGTLQAPSPHRCRGPAA